MKKLSLFIVIGLFWGCQTGVDKQLVSGKFSDPLNGTYLFEESGETTLVKGEFEEVIIPGGASKRTVSVVDRYEGDLTNNGFNDTILILAENLGGTGVFYKVVAAIREEDGYRGSNALFIGDRISPQTVEIEYKMIILHYLERAPDEAFSSELEAKRRAYIILDGSSLELNGKDS